jgi:hypothetical protein
VTTRCFICWAAAPVFSSLLTFAQTPANDNFDNRTVLSGNSVSFSGSLSNATLESGEPPLVFGPNPLNGSIWWTWTATASTPVIISVSRDYSAGAMVGAALEVFSGTDLASLQGLDGTSFDVPAGRYSKFMAGAGSNYQFRVSGYWPGTVSAQLTASTNPVIIQQPQNCTVSPYGSASFYVIAAGIPKTTNQWLFNEVPIPGETAPSLVVRNVVTNNAGNYSVIVSNSGGATESPAAVLTVTDTNPLPRVTALRPTNASTAPFLLTGEPGRWYRFEVTSNVFNWPQVFGSQFISSFAQATNTTNFYTTLRTNAQQTYVRVTLSSNTDICVAQLKRLRAARDLYAIGNKQSPLSSYTLSVLKPYVRIEPAGNLPACPAGGTYSVGATITNSPSCSLPSIGHVLP